MITDKELSKVEREVVLQSIKKEMINITIKSREENNKFAVFPIALSAASLSIENNDTIIIKRNLKKTVEPFLDKIIRVEFYFNHMGLYFDSCMTESFRGYCISVPKSVFRMQKSVEKTSYNFYGSISYKDERGCETLINCVPQDFYALFESPSWIDISEEKTPDAKIIFDQIMNDYSFMSLNCGDSMFIINICRYALEDASYSVEPVEGAFKPLDIIYIDDERVVLASREAKNAPLNIGADYDLIMYSSIGSNSRLKRRIRVNIGIEYEFKSAVNGSCCFVGHYRTIKAEDHRYLYEKTVGKILA